MITVRFFADLREQLDCTSHSVDWTALRAQQDTPTIQTLLNYLCETQPHWAQILTARDWLSAHNQTMSDRHQPIESGDEIAFFPPVTGG